jgi:hypothetical protein
MIIDATTHFGLGKVLGCKSPPFRSDQLTGTDILAGVGTVPAQDIRAV